VLRNESWMFCAGLFSIADLLNCLTSNCHLLLGFVGRGDKPEIPRSKPYNARTNGRHPYNTALPTTFQA
jgi:hypothetical protein